jgi:hypothetical protein
LRWTTGWEYFLASKREQPGVIGQRAYLFSATPRPGRYSYDCNLTFELGGAGGWVGIGWSSRGMSADELEFETLGPVARPRLLNAEIGVGGRLLVRGPARGLVAITR